MTGPPLRPEFLRTDQFDLLDGLAPLGDDPGLHALIAAEIRSSGPMTFCRFMELVLYHPDHGYYMRTGGRVGREGDYVTSPEMSPIFGYAVARQIAECWRCVGSPATYDVVECGGGSGRLAADICRWLAAQAPELAQALRYRLIERSPMQSGQLRQSSDHTPARPYPELLDTLTLPRIAAGCVLANELLDSFAIHRVLMRSGQLRELYVTLNGEQFVEIEGEASSHELAAYFHRLGIWPGDNCSAEVNFTAPEWLDAAAGCIDRGHIMLFDYGLPAKQLYAPWRGDGTLLCYRRHEVSSNPYQSVGNQDITSHVDFTTLALAGQAAGLELLGHVSQGKFLTSMGVDTPPGAQPPAGTDAAAFFNRRRAAEALVDPAGLGRISVLLFGRNVPSCGFAGFSDSRI